MMSTIFSRSPGKHFKRACAAAFVGMLSFSPGAHAFNYCDNVAGLHENYFVTHWSSVPKQVCIGLYSGGQYGYTWTNASNFVGGKGWQIGSTNKVVGYNAGYFSSTGNSVLALYGWSTNPLVEYYVVDSWNGWRPPGGHVHGTVQSDGGTYDLYISQRYNAPNVTGRNQNFTQYWSVRQTPRPQNSNNYITFRNHVNAWARKGWNLGNMNYQVMAVEGYRSSGGANVSVWGW